MKKWFKLLLIFIGFLGLLLTYFYIFVLLRPFGTEITQDRPMIKILCEMQVSCNSGIGPFSCRDDPHSDSFKRLSRWKGFKGCNNLTKGYEEGYVIIESCSCGGWM